MKVWTALQSNDDGDASVKVYDSLESLTQAVINDVEDMNEGCDNPASIPSTLDEAIEIMANNGIRLEVAEKDVLPVTTTGRRRRS